MGIGSKIRALRANRGWKQGKLAKKSGVSQTHLSQIERERIEAPHWSTIKSLLDALNVNGERMLKKLLQNVSEEEFLEACGIGETEKN